MTESRMYRTPELPVLSEFDWLVIMGGPMSVHDHVTHPWLAGEKQFIESAIDSGKTVLGICLGAQLIADVLGANVRPNMEKEIGWFPVEIPWTGRGSPVMWSLPMRMSVFHWHGDTFGLPNGARLLAQSDGCRHQAFSFKDRVVALQFHLEITPRMYDSMKCLTYPEENAGGKYVQTWAQMDEQRAGFAEANRYMRTILDNMRGV